MGRRHGEVTGGSGGAADSTLFQLRPTLIRTDAYAVRWAQRIQEVAVQSAGSAKM